MVNLVGDSIGGLLPIPWSIGFVLLGLSHAKQAANTLGMLSDMLLPHSVFYSL